MRSSKTLALLLALCLLVPLTVAQAGLPDQEIVPEADGISWAAPEPFGAAKLAILGPDGLLIEQSYKAGEPLFWSATAGDYPDGEYSYELVIEPEAADAEALDGGREAAEEPARQEPKIVHGEFGLAKSKLVPVGNNVDLMALVHPSDTVIQGSLCVGFDCQNGESFGFDTMRLKENNLRIHFQDTSSTASFPSRDWRIVINDSANGGANYFAVQDADSSRNVFLVEAGAPANSLYVEDYGRVGFGTSTPVVELHVKDGDTPTLRLDQSSAYGWSPQTWDVAGNESNFFIRDASNGGKLPFRIQPSTPSSALCLKSDGKVGIGTWSPAYTLEVENSGQDSIIAAERTDGATAILAGRQDSGVVGTASNHDLYFMVNGSPAATLGVSGTLSVGASPNDASMYGQGSSAYFGTEGGQFVKFYVGDKVVGRLDANGNLAISGNLFPGMPLSSASDEPIKGDGDVAELKAEIAAQNERIADLEARLVALEAALLSESPTLDTASK